MGIFSVRLSHFTTVLEPCLQYFVSEQMWTILSFTLIIRLAFTVNLVLSQQNILSLQIVSLVSFKHSPDKNYDKNISGDVKSSQEQTYSELNTPLVVEELQDPLKQFLKK